MNEIKRVIDGKLCHKVSDGGWRPYTLEELTATIQRHEDTITDLMNREREMKSELVEALSKVKSCFNKWNI